MNIIYKTLLKKIHPDLNKESTLNNKEISTRIDLLKKFKDNNDILSSLAISWGYDLEQLKSESDDENINFIFPYPNVEFRVSDYVSVDNNIFLINNIRKMDDGMWEFTLEDMHNEKNIKKVIRSSINSGMDRKFYLYNVRKDTDKKIQY